MNKVQEALKSAINFIEETMAINAENFKPAASELLDQCKSALSDIENCEPVAEALHERNRLGYAVVDVIGALDEIIENAQEVEVDDFLHIAVPVDMWNELQAELEYMPKRADLYTSPQPRDWVDVTYEERRDLYKSLSKGNIDGFADLLSARLKQLNTRG